MSIIVCIIDKLNIGIVLLTLFFSVLAVSNIHADDNCAGVAIPDLYQVGDDIADIIQSVSLSPDGEQLAIARASGVYIHDGNTLELTQVLQCRPSSPDPLYPVAWSPDGEKIATYNEEDGISIWDLQTDELITYLRDENDEGIFDERGEMTPATRVYDMVWSPDSRYIASIGDLPLRVWDVDKAQIVFTDQRTIPPGATQPGQLVWSPDGTSLAFSDIQRIFFWNSTNWESSSPTLALPNEEGRIHSLSWSNDNYLAVGVSRNFLHVWDLSSQTLVISPSDTQISSLVVSWLPGTNILAIARTPNDVFNHCCFIQIDIINVSTGEVLHSLTGHSSSVIGLFWYPDGERLLSFESEFPNSRVILWNVESGEILAELSTDNN